MRFYDKCLLFSVTTVCHSHEIYILMELKEQLGSNKSKVQLCLLLLGSCVINIFTSIYISRYMLE